VSQKNRDTFEDTLPATVVSSANSRSLIEHRPFYVPKTPDWVHNKEN
jgi:hypothetical protein